MKLGFARNLDSDCEEKSPKSNPNFLQKWPRILRERERERERTGTTDKVTEIRVVSEENHIKQNEQRWRERERLCEEDEDEDLVEVYISSGIEMV